MRTDLEFHNDICTSTRFRQWAREKVGKSVVVPVTPTAITGQMAKLRYTVELVHKNDGTYAVSYDDSYGGYASTPRGYQGESSLIFKITYTDEDETVVLFFKKFGTVDSYSAVEWDGKWHRVSPRTREVTEYVFE